ncbi:MAG TPA: type II toxin-antitoxin system HicB family antitoxin [archaeon]|nr:type II toxin-antitoxin system HicB family antitoxin [archaeon]
MKIVFFFASVPELPGCYSQGDSIRELKENIKEAIEAYLEAITEKEKPVSKFVEMQKIEGMVQ